MKILYEAGNLACVDSTLCVGRLDFFFSLDPNLGASGASDFSVFLLSYNLSLPELTDPADPVETLHK